MMKVGCVGILVADAIVSPVGAYPAKGSLDRVDSVTLHNGGNAMTAAVNLSKMGVSSAIIGKVGSDMFGDFLRSRLASSGVDTRGLATDFEVQTSVSVVLNSEDGERSFLHCVGTNGTFSVKDVDWSVVEECDLIFVTGTYLLDTFDGEETVEFLKKCKEMGKTTFLDVCWDAKGRWGEVLNPAMPYLDFLMPSIDEAVRIAGESEPDRIADVFMARGAKNVVIKLGKRGSYLRLAGEASGREFPAVGKNIRAVDTTGAGDSFCSGFLAAYSRGESPEKCIEIANATGALCVTAKGATTGIRTYDETVRFLEENR
ncbi:MAG: carbohydrate kinase family protein [Clostridia bacterium]|nr:carbohydrate kinase family protein [Clostridia bacterium]